MKSCTSAWKFSILKETYGFLLILPSGERSSPLPPPSIYTIEELKWDILILRWRGIGNDLK
jgi:hypothetical protein